MGLTLVAGVTADSLTFGLHVTPYGGAPALTTGAVSFSDSIGGAFKNAGGTHDSIAVVWAGLDPALSGSSAIGSISFTMPAAATDGQIYSVSLTSASALLGNATVNISGGSPQIISVVELLKITGPNSLPVGTAGAAYPPTTVTATGGMGRYFWSATGLPGGMSINVNSGAIAGTPTTNAGSPFTVQVTVRDGNSTVANRDFTLALNPALLVTGPAMLPAGTVNVVYAPTTVTATGGNGIYTWSAVGLPNGLNIAPGTGIITGTPASNAGNPVSVTVTATDGNAVVASKTYNLTINGPLAITGPDSLPVATVTAPYTLTTVSATGGSGTYAWSATGLANGLSIGAGTGAITGTPTSSAGSPISVRVTVTDGNLVSANKNYTLTVNPALSISGPATLPAGALNTVYAPTTLTATGGGGGYTWSATGLPIGLNIATGTGIIAGTPGANAGSPYTVQVTVTDSNSVTASRSFGLTVNAGLAVIGPDTLPVATVNSTYSPTTLTATGGSGIYAWSATGLPNGLSLAAGSGLISGMPTRSSGSLVSVVVTVTDNSGVTANKGYSLKVNPALLIAGPAALATATVSASYSPITLTATGGSGTYAWTANGLPNGLSIAAITGVISGAPTSNSGSPVSVQVTVTDSNAISAQRNYMLTVNPALSITAPGTLPAGTKNVVYSGITVTATGGNGTYSWTATGLPAGLAIAISTGAISGTPATNAGSPFAIVVTVTDGNAVTANKSYSIVINGPLSVSTPASLPAATVNSVYPGATATATGGNGIYIWSATGLPNGLNIAAATGIISGTPASNLGSPFAVEVTVTDGNLVTAKQSYNLTVNAALSISAPDLLPAATSGVVYSGITITATGGSGTYIWSASGLPGGLNLAATGAITGTPTGNSNSFTVLVTVTDSNSVTAKKSYNLTVNTALTVTGPVTLPIASVNSAYSATTATATGGSGAYVWSATGLPAGLSIAPGTGIITGIPVTNTGSPVSVQLTVTDSNSVGASKSYILTVTPELLLTGPATLPVAAVNSAYRAFSVSATGGSGSYTWAATGLPGGLNMAALTGIISGAPTTNAGSPFSVQVTVSDSDFVIVKRTYTLAVNLAVVISSPVALIAGTMNAVYPPTTVIATGGGGVYTWSATGLPNGISIDAASGAISGTPTTNVGSPFNVQVTAADRNSAVATRSYGLIINGPLAVSQPATLPVGSVNTPYPPTTLSGTGGTAPYTWSATGLPSGLTLARSTGILSGTPTTNTGSPFSVIVTVTDSNSATAGQTYPLTVNLAIVFSAPAQLPVGTVNAAYPLTSMIVSGGSGVFAWSATGLPSGLNLNAVTGVLTGTPTTNAGSPFAIQVMVTDSASATANRRYTLTVNPALVISAPASLPVGLTGVAYTITATATGGSGSYSWSATGLPPGLSLNAVTGVINGTPTTSGGSFTVRWTVTDSNSVTATRSYAMTVNPPVSISGPASLPAGIANSEYPPSAVTANGGSLPYTWSATGLPNGMRIDAASGVISGMPSTITGNPFTVQVTVTDGNYSTATRGYTLNISAIPLTITAPLALSAGIVNVAYPPTGISAAGGTGSYTWSATGLPPGLRIDAASGIITGSPAASAGSPYTVKVIVSDENWGTDSRSFSLSISGMLTVAAPNTLPAGNVGATYPPSTLTAGGGAAPYLWKASGLPEGLSIGLVSGTIAGIPVTNTGSPFQVVVTVTDRTGASVSRTYALTINVPAKLVISGPASLPAGTVNVDYPATTPTADGISGNCNWWASGLPLGLIMDPGTGAIIGMPTSTAGSPFTVVIWVIDETLATASRSYILTVGTLANAPPATISVSNAAGGQPEVASNSWVSIYGTNFVPAGFIDDWSKSMADGKMPITLDGVSVSVGGRPAYLSYLSATQVNVLLPEVGLGPLQTTITTPGGTSTSITVNSQPYSPAFFPWPNHQPVATHLDYTLAAKDGTFGVLTVPAKPGEVLVLWGTGFGPTTPPAPAGIPVPLSPIYITASPVTVLIGETPAAVYGTALSPGFGGLYQLVITVPASLPDGDYTVTASINGVITPPAILTVSK